MIIKYKEFIEDNFMITTVEGETVPFIFNDIQTYYYNQMIGEYGPELVGVRENILKSRRFGFSSIIDAIFTVDFILSELGEIPLTNSDVYSYKQDDTETLFTRVNVYVDSWLLKSQGGDYRDPSHRQELKGLRKKFLKSDVRGTVIAGHNGAEYHCLTAGAKVSGRGGTKQNIHWSEVAFYNNTPMLDARVLVTGVEQQVTDGVGKIFRETTGNVSDDFFAEEYEQGKDGENDFKSRFLAWYQFGRYTKPAPAGWEPPEYYQKIPESVGVTVDQCYWHYIKTKKLQSKLRMREYPTTDTEAFLLGGDPWFDESALVTHAALIKEPVAVGDYAASL